MPVAGTVHRPDGCRGQTVNLISGASVEINGSGPTGARDRQLATGLLGSRKRL